jgi:hypothetical protein
MRRSTTPESHGKARRRRFKQRNSECKNLTLLFMLLVFFEPVS